MEQQMIDSENPANTVWVACSLSFVCGGSPSFLSSMGEIPAIVGHKMLFGRFLLFCPRRRGTLNSRKKLTPNEPQLSTLILFLILIINTCTLMPTHSDSDAFNALHVALALYGLPKKMARCRVEECQKCCFLESFLTELPPDLHLTVTFPGRFFPVKS